MTSSVIPVVNPLDVSVKKGNYEIIILVYVHSKVYHTFRGSYYTFVVTRRPFFTVLLARYTVRTQIYSKHSELNNFLLYLSPI